MIGLICDISKVRRIYRIGWVGIMNNIADKRFIKRIGVCKIK